MNANPIKTARIAGAYARDHYTAAAAEHLRAIYDPAQTFDLDHDRAIKLLDRAYTSEHPDLNPLDAEGWPVIRWSLEP